MNLLRSLPKTILSLVQSMQGTMTYWKCLDGSNSDASPDARSTFYILSSKQRCNPSRMHLDTNLAIVFPTTIEKPYVLIKNMGMSNGRM